ncbi:MAG: DUF5317 family protein [Acidimicrobiales bacterium]
MLIFPLSLGGGLALGRLGGGRLAHLGGLRFRATPLLLAALVGQIGLRSVAPAQRFPLLVLTYALAGAWVGVNLRGRSTALRSTALRSTALHSTALRSAVALLALGWMLNAAPIAANGSMPVSGHALGQTASGSGIDRDIDTGNIDKHITATGGSRLRLLGDVIPLRPLGAVVSFGDLALMTGIVLAVAAGMRPVRQEQGRSGSAGPAVPPDEFRAPRTMSVRRSTK